MHLHEFCVCGQNPLVVLLCVAARGFKLVGVISELVAKCQVSYR